MSIFGIFIIPIFIILAIVIGIVITFSRLLLQLFGFGSNNNGNRYAGNRGSYGTERDTTSGGTDSHSSGHSSSGRKIIGDDEGEYVEFEEVK